MRNTIINSERVLQLAMLVWLLMVLTNLRPPWQGLVSDSAVQNLATKRQLIFGVGGVAGFIYLTFRGSFYRAVLCFVPCLMWLGYCFFSLVWSPQPALTVKRSAVLLLGYIMIAAFSVSSKRPLALCQRWIVLVTGFLAVGSIGAMVALPKICWSPPMRDGLAGLTNHPNTLGIACGIGWIASLGWHGLHGWRWLFLQGLRLALFASVILTGSKSSLMLMILGTLVYAILVSGRYRRSFILLVTPAVLAIVGIIGPNTIFAEATGALGRDTTLTGRTELWELVWAEAMKHPWAGTGLGAFWVPMKGYELTGTWNPRQSHNSYLDLFNELGLVGAVFFILAFHGVVVRAISSLPFPEPGRRDLDGARRAAMLAFCAMILFYYSMLETCLMKVDNFPFLALLWTLICVYREVIGLDGRDRSEQTVESPVMGGGRLSCA
ncbi:MAG: O-antigen ligase family protein [Phycisphaerae bacterium]